MIRKDDRYHWHWGAYKQLGLSQIILKVELSLLKSQGDKCLLLQSIKINFSIIAHVLSLNSQSCFSPSRLSIIKLEKHVSIIYVTLGV